MGAGNRRQQGLGTTVSQLLGWRPTADGHRGPRHHTRQQAADRLLPPALAAAHRNPGVEADADVAKRVFDTAGGATHVHYHYGTNRVTACYRIFPKDGAKTQAFQAGVAAATAVAWHCTA
jgi:hypothetical protein